jgi:hypothetical protein
VKDCAPLLPIDFGSCRDPIDIMAVETEERRQPLLLKRPRLLAVRTRAAGDNDWRTAEPATDSVRAYAPAAQEPLLAKRRVLDFLPGYEEKPPEHGRNTDELRRCLRRQDALVCAIGLLLLAVAAVATYLYWEYAWPFVASDDPFLAVRQFPIVVRPIAANLAWQRAAG